MPGDHLQIGKEDFERMVVDFAYLNNDYKKNLEYLNLSYSRVRGLRHIMHLVGLKELWCGGVADEDFRYVEQLPRLEFLRCWLIEDASLSNMPQLRHLAASCRHSSVTIRLRNLPKLESLDPPYGVQVQNVELENVPLLGKQSL